MLLKNRIKSDFFGFCFLPTKTKGKKKYPRLKCPVQTFEERPAVAGKAATIIEILFLFPVLFKLKKKKVK